MLQIDSLQVNYGGIEAVKGISFEECARITAENGKRFFRIP